VSEELVILAPEDAATLASLHAESADMPWSADSFSSLLLHRNRFGWLARVHDRAAGYILVQAIAGDAEILSLAVRPAMQGQGLGRRLVERALQDVRRRGAGRLLLEVAASNAPARALYGRLGFRAIGTRRAYYQRPGGLEDALVMSYVFEDEAGLSASANPSGGQAGSGPEM
jgi:ribosomal-protein-alanine N-acetyltransferase